jgi:hypothetical protein
MWLPGLRKGGGDAPRENAHSDYYTKTGKWDASIEKYRRIWISTGCKAKVDIESE